MIEVTLGDRVMLEKAPLPWRVEPRGRRLVAVPNAPVPMITAAQVRETPEKVRRREL